jgi:hypothetical protein
VRNKPTTGKSAPRSSARCWGPAWVPRSEVDEGRRSVPEQARLGVPRLAWVRPDKRNIRFSSGMTSPMRSACIHVVIKCRDISRLEFRHHHRPATIPRRHLRPGTIAEGGAEGGAEGRATTIVAGDSGKNLGCGTALTSSTTDLITTRTENATMTRRIFRR